MADVKVSVIYYSATGSVYALAQSAVEAAEKAGAEVRLRKVHELAPKEAIASNEGWSKHALETDDVPEATADDVVWADAVIFGTPTRYGNVAAQLKQFFDTLGPQWSRGELADKVYTGFTSTGTNHGGQESTLLAMYNSFYHFGGSSSRPATPTRASSSTATPTAPRTSRRTARTRPRSRTSRRWRTAPPRRADR